MQVSEDDALEEFDIEKYNACEDWSANDWLIALSQRVYMLHFLHRQEGGISKWQMPARQVFKNERQVFLKLAEERLREPIPNRQTSQSLPRIITPNVISDFMLTDIFNVIDSADVEAGDRLEYVGIRLRDIEKAMGVPSDTFYLKIDLGAPDKLILQKFENWLTKTREESGVAPKSQVLLFKKEELKNWHANKLLPFLDLAFWRLVSGQKLTDGDILNKLYPSTLEIDKNKMTDLGSKAKSITDKALKIISQENVERLATFCQIY